MYNVTMTASKQTPKTNKKDLGPQSIFLILSGVVGLALVYLGFIYFNWGADYIRSIEGANEGVNPLLFVVPYLPFVVASAVLAYGIELGSGKKSLQIAVAVVFKTILISILAYILLAAFGAASFNR
jgi:hypothetical protein